MKRIYWKASCWTLMLLALATLSLLSSQSTSAQGTSDANQPPAYRQYGAWTASEIGSGGYGQDVIPTSDPNVWYTYMDVGGVWRSDDAGDSWRRITVNLGDVYPATRVRGLVVDPADPNHLVIATGTYFAGERSGVYVTRDANATEPTWTNTVELWWHEGAARSNGYVLVQAAPDSDVLYAASDGDGFYVSEDFGETWTASGLDEIYQASDITVDPANPNRIWVSALDYDSFDFVGGSGEITVEGGLYFTTNRGAFWTKLHDYDETNADANGIPANNTPTEMIVLSDGRLLGIFNNVVVKISSDNGQTWQLFSTGIQLAEMPIDVQFDQSGATFAALTEGPNFVLVGAGDGRIYRLNDGETMWTEVNPAYLAEWNASNTTEGDWWGNPSSSPRFETFGIGLSSINIDPANPGHWFITDRFSIWETTDAGVNWVRSTEGIETTIVNHITQDPAQPNRVYASLSDIGLFISEDGGATFDLSAGDVRMVENGFAGAATFTISSPTDPQTLYAIGGGEFFNSSTQIYVSADDGQSWSAVAMTGLPGGRTINALGVQAAGSGDALYATVSGPVTGGDGSGGVYRSTDGGQGWALFGSGLDATTPNPSSFFAETHYGRPQELAVSSNGDVVAISIIQGELYYLDGNQWVFNDVYASGFEGRLISVWSDPNQAGQFYAVLEGVDGNSGGLWRSSDGGRSWIAEPLPSTAAPVDGWLALDAANPGRLALATANGLIYRANASAGWSQVDRSLPVRFFDYATFSGERLLAGTNGGGVFYTDVPAPVEAENLGTLTGRVFVDANENGALDAGESAVTGASVQLAVAGAGGAPGAVYAAVTTGADGVYRFENVPFGNYVAVLAALPTGFSAAGDTQAGVALSTATATGPDFAVVETEVVSRGIYLPLISNQ